MKNKTIQIIIPVVVLDRVDWLVKDEGNNRSAAIRNAINNEYARRTGSSLDAPSRSLGGRPRSSTKPTQEMKVEEMKAMSDIELTKYIYEIGYCVDEKHGDRMMKYWIGVDDAGNRVLWRGWFRPDESEPYDTFPCWNFGEMISEMKKLKFL